METKAKQGSLTIHTEKLLPIIKKWLYSDKEIFLRELVSNACDALYKRKVLQDEGQAAAQEEERAIQIHLDETHKTLSISDTGIGMTGDEVEKYIAQLAFSGAEEFLEKYQSKEPSEQVIGHFGLGFYSAYMVASKVEIDTLSYKEGATPAFWSCDGSAEYTLDIGTRKSCGTTITLFLEDEEFATITRLEEILNRYCAFLPYPIYLNGTHINQKEPLWLKSPSECTDEEYLAFHEKLYPFEEKPLFWVHLNIDYPFHVKGVLYFPKVDPRFDIQKPKVKLFCNRVFVSDNCQDLIPDYLLILKGAIDSPDIPLNVSRSYLQMDKTVRSLSSHIAKKVADKLTLLFQQDRAAFEKLWDHIDIIIKLGALQDDKFYDKVKGLLLWKSTQGSYLTASEYLSQASESAKKTLFYTQDPQALSLRMYEEKHLTVLIAQGPLDPPLMSLIEKKELSQEKFQRIDGGLDKALIDEEKQKSLLHADGRPEYAHIADQMKSYLTPCFDGDFDIKAESLSAKALPLFTLVSEETRRLKETLALHKQMVPSSFKDKKTCVVNTNSPLIQALLACPHKEVAQRASKHLYQLSELAQKQLQGDTLNQFIDESYSLLQDLLAEKKGS